jgi:hypothetical protein
MVELAPVRLVANDPIYEVLPAYLEMLSGRGQVRDHTAAGSGDAGDAPCSM